MLRDSEDPVVKTVQTTIKTRKKWNVVGGVDQTKECLKIKEVIGQTQTYRKGLVKSRRERDMVINDIRLCEDFRRVQKAVQQPYRDSGLIGIVLAEAPNIK